MRKLNFTFFPFLLFLTLITSVGNGQIAAWNFTTPVLTATTADPNLTASAISVAPSTAISYQASPGDIFATAWSTSATFSTSGKYWQFSIAPNSGYQVTLSSVTFKSGSTSTGPQKLQVQYSLDGFATAGITALAETANSNQSTLTQSTLTALPGVTTSTITFRIWGYNSSASGNFRLNNIVVNGTVDVPATAGSATQLGFSGAPATGIPNTNLSSFTVKALKADGVSIDASYTTGITITKASGPGNLTGTTTQTPVNGVATFNDLKFDQAGTYTLTANSGTLTSATTGNIVVADGTVATDYFQSQASGNWGDVATWQSSHDNVTWINATATPDNNATAITVQSVHTVTVAASVAVGQVVINGNVTIAAAATLTVDHGTASKDLIIANAGTLLNQGTLSIGTSGTWEIQNGGTFIHNATSGISTPLSSATLDNGSTFVYRGSSSISITPSISSRTYSNLSLQSAAGTWSPSNTSGGGAFTVNGKLSVGTGVNWSFTGFTGAMLFNGGVDVMGTFTPNSFSIPSATTLSVYPGGVLVVPASQTISVGSGSFLILSDATGTGSIGNSAGTISGNVTVQRYVPAHAARAYTLVSSPVSSPTIFTGWQEAGASTVGFGTQISGGSSGNGFDFASAAGIASIYGYNDANTPGTKWVGLTNTNSTNVSAGTGYLLFVRGDRTVGAGAGAPQATTLRATGTLTTGAVSFATTGGTSGTPALLNGANLYNLIANPYACAIKWTTVTKTNLSGTYTVYDPNLVSFVTSDGTTVSPNVSQQQANVLQSGQAFFIQNDASGNTPALTVNETDKNTTAATGTSNTVFGMAAPSAQLNVNFYKAGNAFADGIVAVFNSNYSKNEDAKDAAKFTNFSETVSFAENNNRSLSIDARPMPQGSDTLFVNTKQMVANTSYSIAIDGTGFNSANMQSATLIDKVTGTITALNLSAKTSYPFTTTAASEAGRFMIVLNSAPVVTVPAPIAVDSSNNSALHISLLGNPVKDNIVLNYTAKQAGNTTIRLISANGKAVTSMSLGVQQQGTVTIPVTQYAGGLYLVEVTVGSNKALAKVIKD